MHALLEERHVSSCVHLQRCNLKRVATRHGVEVILSALSRLVSQKMLSQPANQAREQCRKGHRTPFVKCVIGVVHEILFSFGKYM